MPFIRAGALTVHYIERGSGTPVVLVHGNWATCSWWQPVLGRLPDGWHGLACDLRRRGRTTGPDSDYGIPSLAGDLLAFTEALGLDPAHLVGHSLGSAVAMQFALDQPAGPLAGADRAGVGRRAAGSGHRAGAAAGAES